MKMKSKKISIILIAALVVVFFVVYDRINFGGAVYYKISYTVAANGVKVEGAGVFKASLYGRDDILVITGEAIPIPLPDGRIIVFSLGGGEPMLVPGRSDNTKHSISPDKFFLFAFPDYTDIFALRGSIKKLKEASPTVTVNPTVLPAIYISSEPHSQKDLAAVPRTELAGHNIKILSIQVSITNEKITDGRIEKFIPWLRSDISDRLLISEFIQK